MKLRFAFLYSIICLLVCFLISPVISPAISQVIQDQTNAIVIGRVAKQLGVNLIGDSGSALGGPAGSGITELGITNNTNCGLGITSGPITVGFRQICIGFDTNGVPQITVVSTGLSSTNLNFNINGSVSTYPGTGTGNVLGPNSSSINFVPVFNNTAGSLLAMSSLSVSGSIVSAPKFFARPFTDGISNLLMTGILNFPTGVSIQSTNDAFNVFENLELAGSNIRLSPNGGGGLYIGSTAGANCGSGVTAATVVVISGIVVHC